MGGCCYFKMVLTEWRMNRKELSEYSSSRLLEYKLLEYETKGGSYQTDFGVSRCQGVSWAADTLTP